ncbi:uncharacterized protein LOC114517955 [Dendronephthya gigantea]|uniref:uncharacterized protein LOC114517955 n=1 Tax=Dendronephthya gigantea TaxID=151771 RepID=UPI00106A9BF1|nr:uncharacterized protein LOC114517955 [Dendronephthya gigantea]
MGDKDIYQPGCLRKGNYRKGKLMTQPLSECLEEATVEAAGLLGHMKATPFRAIITEKQTLVNSDSPIVYVDDQHQHHLGIFKKGLKVENRELVAVETINFCKNDANNQVFGSFQCPKVERTGSTTILSSDHIIDQACLIHDCFNGNCSFRETEKHTSYC